MMTIRMILLRKETITEKVHSPEKGVESQSLISNTKVCYRRTARLSNASDFESSMTSSKYGVLFY